MEAGTVLYRQSDIARLRNIIAFQIDTVAFPLRYEPVSAQ